MARVRNTVACVIWFVVAAAFTPKGHATEWATNGTFSEGLKGWKKFQRDKSARVELALVEEDGAKIARLSVSPDTPAVASIDHDLRLPARRGMMCVVSATYRTVNVTGAQAKLVTIARGGKTAGNGRWFATDGIAGTTPWRRETLTRVIPADAKSMKLRLYLAGGSGQILVKSVSVRPLTAADITQPPVRVRIHPDQTLSRPTALHFAVNAVYHFPGMYDGVLPPSDPRSKRIEFIKALKAAGIRAIRFPGGMACHRYLAESQELTERLAKLMKRATGDYEKDWPRGLYPRWQDVRDTAKLAGIKIIYTFNTSFYADERGGIRPVNDCKFTQKAGLADGKDHSEEAGRALDGLFEKGIFKPGDVDYWEIGNEEFSFMKPDLYANIAAAYTRVLAKRDPGRPICYTGGRWNADLIDLLSERSVLKQLTGVTSHYPFSRWPRPSPPTATADYEALARADVGFERSLDNFAAAQKTGRIPSHLRKSISETSVYKFFTYDPFRMTCSFAHALAFARNWPALIRHPATDMAVFHDLEATFFGMMMYHVEFNQITRRFEWLGPHVKRAPNTKNRSWFIRQYVLTPTAYVMAMLSRFEGVETVAVETQPDSHLAGALVGRAPGRMLLFISNPQHEPIRLIVPWPAAWSRPTSGTWRMVEADSVYPVLAPEYRRRTLDAPMPSSGRLDVILPPLSVHLFEWAHP